VDLSQLPPEVVGGATASGMFAGLYWMLATGRLYTRSQHSEIVAVKDQQIADKAEQVVVWRAVGETAQAQTGELLASSRLQVQLLQGIADRAEKNMGAPQ